MPTRTSPPGIRFGHFELQPDRCVLLAKGTQVRRLFRRLADERNRGVGQGLTSLPITPV